MKSVLVAVLLGALSALVPKASASGGSEVDLIERVRFVRYALGKSQQDPASYWGEDANLALQALVESPESEWGKPGLRGQQFLTELADLYVFLQLSVIDRPSTNGTASRAALKQIKLLINRTEKSAASSLAYEPVFADRAIGMLFHVLYTQESVPYSQKALLQGSAAILSSMPTTSTPLKQPTYFYRSFATMALILKKLNKLHENVQLGLSKFSTVSAQIAAIAELLKREPNYLDPTPEQQAYLDNQTAWSDQIVTREFANRLPEKIRDLQTELVGSQCARDWLAKQKRSDQEYRNRGEIPPRNLGSAGGRPTRDWNY